MGRVGCESTAAVQFSPSFCPIAGLWGCKSGKNCPRWGRFSLSTPQARQAPRLVSSSQGGRSGLSRRSSGARGPCATLDREACNAGFFALRACHSRRRTGACRDTQGRALGCPPMHEGTLAAPASLCAQQCTRGRGAGAGGLCALRRGRAGHQSARGRALRRGRAQAPGATVPVHNLTRLVQRTRAKQHDLEGGAQTQDQTQDQDRAARRHHRSRDIAAAVHAATSAANDGFSAPSS